VNTKSQQGHNVGVTNPAKQIQLILPATTAQIVRTRTGNNPSSVFTGSNGQWTRIDTSNSFSHSGPPPSPR
jgi:hypothetical protein